MQTIGKLQYITIRTNTLTVGNEQHVAQLHKLIADVQEKSNKEETLLRDEERSIKASLDGMILPSSGCYSVHAV